MYCNILPHLAQVVLDLVTLIGFRIMITRITTEAGSARTYYESRDHSVNSLDVTIVTAHRLNFRGIPRFRMNRYDLRTVHRVVYVWKRHKAVNTSLHVNETGRSRRLLTTLALMIVEGDEVCRRIERLNARTRKANRFLGEAESPGPSLTCRT